MSTVLFINQHINNLLSKQAEHGRLGHAYLFFGPKGTGKQNLANVFAAKILGLDPKTELLETLLRHPDYLVFDCLQDSSAESVREFVGKMVLKPFFAQRKFALLANIDLLNPHGANALLKTLEEPPENTVIVLTADTRKVLPTIISRCQTFNFNRSLSAPNRPLSTGEATAASGVRISDYADKTLSERLLAINKIAELEDMELKTEIADFIYQSASDLLSRPEKYTRLAAGLKAFEDLATNKNRKLLLQGLMLKI